MAIELSDALINKTFEDVSKIVFRDSINAIVIQFEVNVGTANNGSISFTSVESAEAQKTATIVLVQWLDSEDTLLAVDNDVSIEGLFEGMNYNLSSTIINPRD